MKAPQVDISFLSSGHDVADARLHRLAAVLVAKGLSVEVRGLGRSAAGPPGTRIHTASRGSLVRRAMRAVTLPWSATGRVLLVLDPDLALPSLFRRWLHRRIGARSRAGDVLVVDVHEDYAVVLEDRAWARGVAGMLARGLVRTAEQASRHADVTIVADEHLPPHGGTARLVVRNLPLQQLLPAAAELEARPRALYVGDVRASRGVRRMIEIFEALPEWSLDIVGPVAAGDRAWLQRWRERTTDAKRIRFHGRLPPREAWRLAPGAWVGLSLLSPTPAFLPALPTKLCEYIACGLAVVSSPLPRAAELMRVSGAGVVVGDNAEAISLLHTWSQQRDIVRQHRANAQAWAASQSGWEAQYEEFGNMVKGLMQADLDRGPGKSPTGTRATL